MNIAVFVSGRGSNLQAILNSQDLQNIVEVKAVISNKLDCAAFEIAGKYSIPVFSVGDSEKKISFTKLAARLMDMKTDLIVLAGFLKLLPVEFINDFRNKIINIHPALLPSFGGEGMYGINVHKAVFESSVKVSGATVHFVDEKFDNGMIIAQSCVDISMAESPEEIADKVLEIEHKLLPKVIEKFALGKVDITGSRVIVR
ncbi:MAG: phosphoribosylglycinamide formyltransferase [Ignavibacteriales bacterium]|nr:MAG: phosphoribosylglycinamide formyltransferase [Ignavibacteriales bacterium]